MRTSRPAAGALLSLLVVAMTSFAESSHRGLGGGPSLQPIGMGFEGRYARALARARSADGRRTGAAHAYSASTIRGGASRVEPKPDAAAKASPTSTTSPSEAGDDHMSIAKKLRNRNATNLTRKFTHASFGIFFACLNHIIPRARFVPGMAIVTSTSLLMELLRYRRGFGWINNVLHFFLGKALRKHEMEGKFTGSFYYFAGVTATAYLYPKTAATLGRLQLALADPSASYFGKMTRNVYWSRIENGLLGFGRNKGLLGFLGGGLFCLPFNFRIFKMARWGAKGVPGGDSALLTASLLLGLAGAFADLAVPTPVLTMPKKVLGVPVPPFHVDDNFVVPVFSGWACVKIFDMLGWDDGLALADYIIA